MICIHNSLRLFLTGTIFSLLAFIGLACAAQATPTSAPTPPPTVAPNAIPTVSSTATPIQIPTVRPTAPGPTAIPTASPTPLPTVASTSIPTLSSTPTPTQIPTVLPTPPGPTGISTASHRTVTATVAAISAAGGHTCAVTTAGGLKCWGENRLGELGDGTTTNRKTPVDVVGLTSDVTAVSGGGRPTPAP